jgi:hypothetical protein
MMKRKIFCVFVFLLAGFLLAGPAVAQDQVDIIRRQELTGPGTVGITTPGDIALSLGARARIIPVSESDYDFGIEDDLQFPLLGGNLPDNFFTVHANESGWINNNYIRTEAQMYFNAIPENKAWTFYAAFEFDRPMENASVDERGGKTFRSSNTGWERLHGTFALPMNMRLHAGFDMWGVDVIDAAGLVYGDDNPGFWLTGDYETVSFNIGYFKLSESNWGTSDDITRLGGKNDDRDLYAGYLTFKPTDGQKFQPFYAFDRIRDVNTGSFRDFITIPAAVQAGLIPGDPRSVPDTDAHHIGAYYVGKFGLMELFLEGVYKFGKAKDVADPRFAHQGDYDISAYAFSGDIAFNLTEKFKMRVGGIYASGDDDPTDDELGGYTGVTNAQRFSSYFGGEHTIIGDTNLVLGSVLYGYVPELYGNGTPIFTGGLENFAGSGNGRGDNPGMTMASAGFTFTPERFLIFRSNANVFWWNEDFQVESFANPGLSTPVDNGYVGTEWDNEITLATSPNSFIKGHFSFFFPGEVIDDVTSALTSLNPALAPGRQSDDIAMRLGMEFIWMF